MQLRTRAIEVIRNKNKSKEITKVEGAHILATAVLIHPETHKNVEDRKRKEQLLKKFLASPLHDAYRLETHMQKYHHATAA